MVCSLVPGHTGAAGLTMQGRPISERQHAQDLLCQNRIQPTRRGSRDGYQVHPGMRLQEEWETERPKRFGLLPAENNGSGTPLRSDHTQNVPELSPCRIIEP